MPRGDIRIEIIPPVRGLRTDIPVHKVPDGYFVAGQNCLCRDGVVMSRPGYTPIVTAAPSGNRVMGGVYYVDNVQTRHTIVGTTVGFHHFDGTSWSTITGSALAGGADNQVRFAVFPLSSSTRVVAVNDVDVPQTWTGSGNFSALGGNPPVARCVTSAFQRVILGNVTVSGTRRSSSMWISDFQTPTSWNSVNEVSLPETGDSIIELRALNDQTFAIYKERSQWVGIGAANLFPFVFELKSQQIGPLSPAAVVTAEGVHYYLGQDGDIYRFDATGAISIGGAVKRTLQSTLDFTSPARSHGFFDATNREIWWFYQNGAGQIAGITYRLPYEDVPGAYSTAHLYNSYLSTSFSGASFSTVTWNSLTGTWNSLPLTYPTWLAFPVAVRIAGAVGDSSGQVHQFGVVGGDNGATLDASFDLPFRAMSGIGERTRVDAVEAFFKQPATTVTAQIVLLLSDVLTDAWTVVAAQSFDLSAGTRLLATYYDQHGRFVSVRHRILGGTGLAEYRGGALYLYRRGES